MCFMINDIPELERQIRLLEFQLEQNPLLPADRFNWSKRLMALKIINFRNRLAELKAEERLVGSISEPLPF